MNRLRMGLACGAAVVWALGLAVATNQADVITVAAFDNATVQPGGPRAGVNGKRFFNIEGNNFGAFASFGVADFQMPLVAGPYTSVSSLTLRMEQSNAGFTTNGLVNFWVSEATGVGIQPGDPIAFDSSQLPDGVGAQLNPIYYLGQGSFVQVANGKVDDYMFALSGAAASYILNQLNSGGVLRVVVSPAEDGVAATYAGFSNTNFNGPRVFIEAETIPEPSLGIALMLLASIGWATRRR